MAPCLAGLNLHNTLGNTFLTGIRLPIRELQRYNFYLKYELKIKNLGILELFAIQITPVTAKMCLVTQYSLNFCVTALLLSRIVMNSKPFFKRTPVKLALATLAILAMLVLGYIPIFIVLHMYQTLTVKIIIASAGVLWAVFSIIWIWMAMDYTKLWKSWFSELKGGKMQRMRENYPEYMELRRKYPMSISSHERHCMHRKPRVSYKVMIESALKVDEKEWAAREEFRREKRAERRAYKEHRPPTLREEEAEQGQKL